MGGRVLVSNMGTCGLFYANAVGSLGAVSAGLNWGLLASAVHRWAHALVEIKEIYLLLFPGDIWFWLEMGSRGGTSLIVTSFRKIPGFPFSEESYGRGNDLVRLGFPIALSAKKCGIFAVKRRCAIGKLRIFAKP